MPACGNKKEEMDTNALHCLGFYSFQYEFVVPYRSYCVLTVHVHWLHSQLSRQMQPKNKMLANLVH